MVLVKTTPWHGFFAYVVPDIVWAKGPIAVNHYLYEVMIGSVCKFDFAHEDDQKDGGVKIFLSESYKQAWEEEINLEARAYASIILNDHIRAHAAEQDPDDDEWI